MYRSNIAFGMGNFVPIYPKIVTLSVMGIFFLAVLFVSCKAGKEKEDDWKTSKSGFRYRLIQNNNGDTIQKNDIVKLHLRQLADDSLLNDTHGQMPEYIKIDSTLRVFDYTELLPLMKVNDSGICVFPIDKIRERAGKNLSLPAFLIRKKDIHVYFKIVAKFSSDSAGMRDYAREKAVKDSIAAIAEAAGFAKAALAFDSLIKQIEAPIKKLPNGVYVQIIEAGKGGPVKKSDPVAVVYRGMLIDGTVFESTSDKSPYNLHAGEGEAVEGLDSGIASLKYGDKAKIFIPAKLAYGAKKMGEIIPAFSNLVFEVQIARQ